MTEHKIIDPEKILLPDCCKDPNVDCKHVAKREKKEKQNIAL